MVLPLSPPKSTTTFVVTLKDRSTFPLYNSLHWLPPSLYYNAKIFVEQKWTMFEGRLCWIAEYHFQKIDFIINWSYHANFKCIAYSDRFWRNIFLQFSGNPAKFIATDIMVDNGHSTSAIQYEFPWGIDDVEKVSNMGDAPLQPWADSVLAEHQVRRLGTKPR